MQPLYELDASSFGSIGQYYYSSIFNSPEEELAVEWLLLNEARNQRAILDSADQTPNYVSCGHTTFTSIIKVLPTNSHRSLPVTEVSEESDSTAELDEDEGG